jgi:hypothetical protein
MQSPHHYVETLVLNVLGVSYLTGITLGQVQTGVAILVGVSLIVLNTVRTLREMRGKRTDD